MTWTEKLAATRSSDNVKESYHAHKPQHDTTAMQSVGTLTHTAQANAAACLEITKHERAASFSLDIVSDRNKL